MTRPKTRIEMAYEALKAACKTTDHNEAFRQIRMASAQLISQSHSEPQPPNIPSEAFMKACEYWLEVLVWRVQLRQNEDVFRVRDFLRAKINIPSKTR
jgi:tRNA U34 5-methylaminomethyl-2-thiouridine-forming methyltransferase MnmC